MRDFLFIDNSLEEKVSVVCHFSIDIKFIHKVACILSKLLANLLFLGLSIKLTGAHGLISNFEKINTCITFYDMLRELPLSRCCYCT